MNARAAFVVAGLLALATPAVPARAAWSAGDTLTVIARPLPSLSAMARAGETFPVWATAPSTASAWAATLRCGSLEFALAPAGGGWIADRARWELVYRVPLEAPEMMYDLVLTSSATAPDTSRHCVKVLDRWLDEFDFAQITDTHLPTHAFSSDAGFDVSDTSEVADFSAVAADLNLIHPEFVLHTGDLVNEGELEDHLALYEMARAKALLGRLDAPVFLVAGNHDLGGWQATPPPDGTARRAWWRNFGWNWLLAATPGDPRHTQDYSFDYGALHLVGLEAYQNSGSYDHFRPDLYGAQSYTAAQLAWLSADLGAMPQGRTALLFHHYDFGGTLASGAPGPAGSQLTPLPGALAGAIWGHVHGVTDGNRAAKPFNLGLQATCDGSRTFRVFHVAYGEITPGPMHHAGGTAATPLDSLTVAWLGPNDGSRARNTAVVTHYYNERFAGARLVFWLADHDSALAATGGTVLRTTRMNGALRVEVGYVMQPYNVMTVSVAPVAPLGVEPAAPRGALALAAPVPSPFAPGRDALRARFTLPRPAAATLRVYDLAGRAVATPFEGGCAAGERDVTWDGRGGDGRALAAGVYLLVLEAGGERRARRVVVLP